MRNEIPVSSQFLESVLRVCPKDSVLIGGQALEYWASKYRLLGDTDDARLTEDIDFLGGSDQSEELAERLSLRIFVPSLDDATPNTARLTARVSGDTYMAIDYLGSIAGLDEKLVARRAIGVVFEGHALRVMHPVDCMESRIANLALIPSKRTPTGVRQAELAVAVAFAYLTAAAKSGEPRRVLKEVERIARIAVSEPAKRVHAKWGIDPLEAVPHDRLPGEFQSKRWPQITAFTDEKRTRFARLLGLGVAPASEPEDDERSRPR